MIRQVAISALAIGALGFGGIASAAAPAGQHPAHPTKLQATQEKSEKVLFKWKAPKTSKSQPLTGFKVYDNGTLLGHTGHSSFTLSDAKWKNIHEISVASYGKYGSSVMEGMPFKRTSVGTTCFRSANGADCI